MNKREFVVSMDKKQDRVARMVHTLTAPLVARMRTRSLQAYRRGEDVTQAIRELRQPAGQILTRASVLAHLEGRTVTAKAGARAYKLDTLSDAMQFTRKRMDLTEDQVEGLEDLYHEYAVEILDEFLTDAERRAQACVNDLISEGAHVREGIERLGEVLPSVDKRSLENVTRTQTALAFMAGRLNSAKDPAIDEILWGWEYATVGDDRVRPNHAALDGARFVKNDPRLGQIAPPNGFQCRCTLIEIFDEGTPKDPEEGWEADEGWDFNPGEMFKDMLELEAA